MACDPLITDPFQFPKRLQNRAGLPRIDYRIGRYDDFVEAMMRKVNAAPELSDWTHRDSDDPGIALLEGAAILGDILSFYQEHYANEAFLRTAAWRESIAELVRLTGYRLAPGLGGRATLAFEARGNSPVVIRKGFKVKVELADNAMPADFQTDSELTAWPHLGRFNLYRQRAPRPTIRTVDKVIELTAVDTRSDTLSLAAFDIKKGDQLMLVPDESMFSTSSAAYRAQAVPQQIKVAKVTQQLGRVIVELDSAPATNWNVPVRAYRIGRSFRHFGHNAPPTVMTLATDSSRNVIGSRSSSTRFERDLYRDYSSYSNYSSLLKTEMPLDIEVSDLSPGRTLIVLGTVHFDGQSNPVSFAVTKRINGVAGRTLQWGNLVGASTVLKIDSQLITNGNILNEKSNIRELRFLEVTSPELRFAPLTGFVAGAFLTGTNALYFYGSVEEARSIAGRHLYLSHADGRNVELVCTNAISDFPVPNPDAPKMWPLSFDRTPKPFTRADFDESIPTVTVFGNLIDASQGKQERETVLGNGDNRQSFQTFPLPKAPLTYFLSAGAIPPQVPELEIWVNNRLWTRVNTFYGHGPKEQIYIVREDADGRSFVQFGDGDNGARLPSGIKNVKAVYRSGVGAHGAIKPSTTPTASERPPGFNKVSLAGFVSGGADPEDLEKAREAAPGKVQSLGRLVSLRDYETEILAIPGVVTTTAAWDLYAGVPAVISRVLLEAGRETEFGDVRAAIAHAQRCRGPDRFALIVNQAMLRYTFLDLTYARDPSYRQEDVEIALRAALGLVGDKDHERTGLFGLRARRIGDIEYASRIEGRLQNVTGVLWCKVSALGLFAAPATGSLPIGDPTTLTLPIAPRPLARRLDCNAHELLQLAHSHLRLISVAGTETEECI